jgi:hypothetical protein
MNKILTPRTYLRYKELHIVSLFLVLVYTNTVMAVELRESNCCDFWKSKVSEAIPITEEPVEKAKSEDERVLSAIECLLTMEGDKSKARFGGATRFNVSQTFEPATSDVAALYYISFLYLGKWDHASAVAIVDDDNRFNDRESISVAYKAYRKWFDKVKDLGLAKARARNLDPLENTQIRWY